MNFLRPLIHGITLGSLALLVMASTPAAAQNLEWRGNGQNAASQVAPPQNGRIRYTKRTTTKDKVVQASQEEEVQAKKTTASKKRIRKTKTSTTAKKSTRLAPANFKDSQVKKAVAQSPAKSTKRAPVKQVAHQRGYRSQSRAGFGMPGRNVRLAQGSNAESLPSSATMVLEPESEIFDGDGFEGGSCSTCGDGGSCGGSCGSDCGRCADTSCCLPCNLPTLEYFELNGGVAGFKGPVDNGRNGNFGASVGANLGGSFWDSYGMAYQFGARYVGSNFNGSVHENNGQQNFQDDTRSQTFITGGFFRRARSCCPWQYGVVFDYMNDNYYYDESAKLTQLRLELSRIGCWGNELGMLVTLRGEEEEMAYSGDPNDTSQFTQNYNLRARDQYVFFVRRQLDCCGEGRLWGGVSGEGDGIVGGDFRMPISESFAVEANFNYLLSQETGIAAQQGDSYGIGINLVWHPRCGAKSAGSSLFRPLFRVADNASFMVAKSAIED